MKLLDVFKKSDLYCFCNPSPLDAHPLAFDNEPYST